MDTSKITLPVAVVLALVVGFGAGYWLFRDAAPLAPKNDLMDQINLLVNSKTPYIWQVQLRGTVKSWNNGVMRLQAEGGTDTAQVVADSETQFIDSSVDSLNPQGPKNFTLEDITVGDELEVVANFNEEGVLLRALMINKIATP